MFRTWIANYRHRRLERQAIRTLRSFDDRRLADIGTFRDSIELFVAAQARADAGEGQSS